MTARETESAESMWHAIWSVHRQWSGYFLTLSAILTVASIAGVYLVTEAGLETLG